MSKYICSVRNEKVYLNGKELLIKGLRCSNALLSDETTSDLISNLDTYVNYGLNTISAFFMGSRYGDIIGYNKDTSLNSIYSSRMERIIEEADKRGMIVLVGCLYWGNSKAEWDEWTQVEANNVVANTIKWLKGRDYRNVIVDVDNEGMARANKNFDTRQMILAAKGVDNSYIVGSNFIGYPPEEADIALHFSDKAVGKPYVESEGTPLNAPGGYWGNYSKERDTNNYYKESSYYNYVNIGVYTEDMKNEQIDITRQHLDKGVGYMFSSTWLQCVPPFGPRHDFGGFGSVDDPGIRWWIEFVKETYGSYNPQ